MTLFRNHEQKRQWRWWYVVVAVCGTLVFFLLAATASSCIWKAIFYKPPKKEIPYIDTTLVPPEPVKKK